jgi:hypothetical protein
MLVVLQVGHHVAFHVSQAYVLVHLESFQAKHWVLAQGTDHLVPKQSASLEDVIKVQAVPEFLVI